MPEMTFGAPRAIRTSDPIAAGNLSILLPASPKLRGIQGWWEVKDETDHNQSSRFVFQLVELVSARPRFPPDVAYYAALLLHSGAADGGARSSTPRRKLPRKGK